ncbi:MAG: site-2 protease family protein [Zoogloeaceae bacterium]|jgi:Zn-dependent protease|nr:site-2 protease family protein [Zoogloeaceae bacterium]
MDTIIQTLAIYAIPVIFAITLHEAAHGYVARHFGDPTAWQAGRITLNPIKHIDPIGTILVPILILLASKAAGAGILFGWAKPVPVDFGRLRRPKQDMLWVAAAGPAANLLMALGWALLLKLAILMPENDYRQPLGEMARIGISINTVLMLLNLLPLPPLDGGRIAVSLLPMPMAVKFARLEPYGFPILLLLLFTGLLDFWLLPLMGIFLSLIRAVFAF